MADTTTIKSVSGRLQTPPDKDGNRQDIHFITDAKSVIYNKDQTVDDKLKELGTGVIISKDVPDHNCLWVEVTE